MNREIGKKTPPNIMKGSLASGHWPRFFTTFRYMRLFTGISKRAMMMPTRIPRKVRPVSPALKLWPSAKTVVVEEEWTLC
jgi:hypothetical protein